MSWIFGYRGNITDDISQKLNEIHPLPIKKIDSGKLYLAYGGNADTCHALEANDESAGLLILGIVRDSATKKLINLHHIIRLENTSQVLGTCDGHFVALEWNTGELHISTDFLGLRELFVASYQNGFLFSTRADWIAKIVPTEIDFAEFGSRWILINQMSKKSYLKNMLRITAGDRAIINDAGIQITESKWVPQKSKPIDFDEFDELLDGIISPLFSEGRKVTLSLSGGMDSRVLLAYMKKYDREKWDCHSFGSPDLPDRIVAEQICRDNGIQHRSIFISGKPVQLHALKEFAASAAVTQTASAYMQLRNYDVFKNSNELIIDGGFGEIWRREFFSRILFLHKADLMKKNAAGLFEGLQSPKADIFSEEVKDIMQRGAFAQIENLFKDFPDVESTGIENWLDLVAARVRFHNYFGPEQTRLDTFATCLMPFMQRSLLENLFDLKLSTRKNGKLFHKIIRKRFPELLGYRLVKGSAMHPATLTSWQTRLWLLGSRMKNKQTVNLHQKQFLEQYKEYINDTFLSDDIQKSGIYNLTNLNSIISDFNAGNGTTLNALDWWFSFALYQSAISNKY